MTEQAEASQSDASVTQPQLHPVDLEEDKQDN